MDRALFIKLLQGFIDVPNVSVKLNTADSFYIKHDDQIYKVVVTLQGQVVDEEYEWSVDCRAYERGWGSKTISTEYFNTKAAADQFVKSYNSVNTSDSVPDWYMMAMTPVRTVRRPGT